MALRLYGDGNIENVTSINSAVSSTELGYLDGVTSAIQSQTNDISNTMGLKLIDNGGISSTTQFNMPNVFLNTGKSYKIRTRLTGSGTSSMYLYDSSGNLLTNTNYNWQVIYSQFASTASADGAINDSKIFALGFSVAVFAEFDFMVPRDSRYTHMSGKFVNNGSGGNFGGVYKVSKDTPGFRWDFSSAVSGFYSVYEYADI